MATTSRSTGNRFALKSGTLAALVEIQSVPLVVLDGELLRAPGRLVHVLREPDPALPERLRQGRDIVRPEIEMKMVPVGGELQVKELGARSDARVEILLLEIQREPDVLRGEANRCLQIRVIAR